MASCKLAEFLYGLIPLPAFRSLLLRLHMEGCPRCENSLVSRDQAGSLLVKAGGLEDSSGMWDRIRGRRDRGGAIREPRTGSRRRLVRLEWVAGAAGVLFLAVMSFWLLRGVHETAAGFGSAGAADRFEIEYVNVGGAPAQAYVYRPGDTDMIFVWAEKSDQGG